MSNPIKRSPAPALDAATDADLAYQLASQISALASEGRVVLAMADRVFHSAADPGAPTADFWSLFNVADRLFCLIGWHCERIGGSSPAGEFAASLDEWLASRKLVEYLNRRDAAASAESHLGKPQHGEANVHD